MYKNNFKRLLDFIFALLLSPFICLIIFFIAPFVYFNDPGPVFYNADRIGKNGKEFKMYKLRTMYNNSPDIRNSDGSTYNSARDVRVTSVGKFLRKTSLDEIPQVFNVLLGDMSFVGPRPTINTNKTEKRKLKNEKRYTVRPGITGYSQALYRNSISQKEKFEHDNYYVDNISLTMDFKILFKTIVNVVKKENIFVSNDN